MMKGGHGKAGGHPYQGTDDHLNQGNTDRLSQTRLELIVVEESGKVGGDQDAAPATEDQPPTARGHHPGKGSTPIQQSRGKTNVAVHTCQRPLALIAEECFQAG